jgi:tetratricopeptide (TPR) repeat protein
VHLTNNLRWRAVGAALVACSCALGCAREGGVARVVDGHVVDGAYVEPETYATFLAGAIAEERGDLKEALHAYGEAARRDARDPEIWTRISRVLCVMSPADDAADASLRRAFAIDANYAGAWLARAECAMTRGHTEIAREAAARASLAEPTAIDLQILWARAASSSARARSDVVRDRLIGLTLVHAESTVAWEALAAWSRTHGDVALFAHAMAELARRAPQKRDALVAAVVALAGEGEIDAARTIAGALADAGSAAGFGAPLAEHHALAARLAVDDALATGDVERVRLRATRTHVGLEEAAGRALLMGRRAVARELAQEIVAADPGAVGARIVLAASQPNLDANALRGVFDGVVGDSETVTSAECVLGFARLIADVVSSNVAARVVVSIRHEALLSGDALVTPFAVDLAARGVLADADLPLDGAIELAARRGEPPPAAALSPTVAAPTPVDARHEYLALAMTRPDSPRAHALGERLAHVRDRDALVAVAWTRVQLARLDAAGGTSVPTSSLSSAVGFDPADPLVAAAALDVAKRRGDAAAAARARANLSAHAHTPAERARVTE